MNRRLVAAGGRVVVVVGGRSMFVVGLGGRVGGRRGGPGGGVSGGWVKRGGGRCTYLFDIVVGGDGGR